MNIRGVAAAYEIRIECRFHFASLHIQIASKNSQQHPTVDDIDRDKLAKSHLH